jgi:thiol-disulfide isomerase/thioredoxin
MFNYLRILAVFIFISSCKQTKQDTDPISGLWRFELQLDSTGIILPFFMEISQKPDKSYLAILMNGEERILHDDLRFENDTLRVKSPIFNSEIIVHHKQNTFEGFWYDYSRGDSYKIALTAKYNLDQRFSFKNQLSAKANGKWLAVFGPDSDYPDSTIGIFNTGENGVLTGTFLTTTGDYRFLEGGFDGNDLKISAFDGSHAFLFNAKLEHDTFFGTFYSGNHFQQDFKAWKNDSFELNNPYEITSAIDGNRPMDFSAISTDKEKIALTDERFKGKPVIVQVLGTWCPNCMDESIFLARNQKQIKDKGVEIVALAFERSDFAGVLAQLKKYQTNLEIEYTFAYAGRASKDSASAFFPQLSNISAFPTTIFLREDHTIYKVHTGYYGPGTGVYFDRQADEFWRNVHEIATPK